MKASATAWLASSKGYGSWIKFREHVTHLTAGSCTSQPRLPCIPKLICLRAGQVPASRAYMLVNGASVGFWVGFSGCSGLSTRKADLGKTLWRASLFIPGHCLSTVSMSATEIDDEDS